MSQNQSDRIATNISETNQIEGSFPAEPQLLPTFVRKNEGTRVEYVELYQI